MLQKYDNVNPAYPRYEVYGMATYKLGKLKVNLSKAGFAFRWGDVRSGVFPLA